MAVRDQDYSIDLSLVNELADRAKESVLTECCGYAAEPGKHPVFFNPYNRKVQCHNCGAIYETKEA